MTLYKETIENRERWFRETVLDRNLDLKMDEIVLENFLDHWTQETTYRKEPVLAFEFRRLKGGFFDIGKRMSMWKRTNPPRKINKNIFPNWPDKRWISKMNPGDWDTFVNHLGKYKWKFNEGMGARSFQKGDKIIWL